MPTRSPDYDFPTYVFNKAQVIGGCTVYANEPKIPISDFMSGIQPETLDPETLTLKALNSQRVHIHYYYGIKP